MDRSNRRGGGAQPSSSRAAAPSPAATAPRGGERHRWSHRAAIIRPSAHSSTVDDLVAQGKLTQDQATKIKDKIGSGTGLGFGRFLAKRKAVRAAQVRAAIAESAATAIGINVKDLRTAFQNGSSIAEVAGQHGVSVDRVKTQITNDAKAKLDAAVQSGKISQAQEDTALQKLSAKLDEIVNKKKS